MIIISYMLLGNWLCFCHKTSQYFSSSLCEKPHKREHVTHSRNWSWVIKNAVFKVRSLTAASPRCLYTELEKLFNNSGKSQGGDCTVLRGSPFQIIGACDKTHWMSPGWWPSSWMPQQVKVIILDGSIRNSPDKPLPESLHTRRLRKLRFWWYLFESEPGGGASSSGIGSWEVQQKQEVVKEPGWLNPK